METTIWLVGRLNPSRKVWDVVDVFVRELDAMEACKSHNYFIVELATIDNLPENLEEYGELSFPFDELSEGC